MLNLTDNISFTSYGQSRHKIKEQIGKLYNLPLDYIIDLSAGDNLFVPPKLIQELIIKKMREIDPRETYPVDYEYFLAELARFIGVDDINVFPGTGHNQLIQSIVSKLTKPNDSILLLNPDKEIYDSIAKSLNLNIYRVNFLDNKKLNINEIYSIVKNAKPKAILFSSPNYPVAIQFEQNEVLSITNELDVPVIIDESYVEFGKYSLANQAKYHENLIIVRTFAKAWGLGAFSCGYVVANEDFINKLSYKNICSEIPPLHILITTNILQNPYKLVEIINNFIKERKKVIEHFRMMGGLNVGNSDTNFLFIKYKDKIDELYKQLLSKGIIAKTFKKTYDFKDHEKYFLVTLGDTKINDRLILSMAEILETL